MRRIRIGGSPLAVSLACAAASAQVATFPTISSPTAATWLGTAGSWSDASHWSAPAGGYPSGTGAVEYSAYLPTGAAVVADVPTTVADLSLADGASLNIPTGVTVTADRATDASSTEPFWIRSRATVSATGPNATLTVDGTLALSANSNSFTLVGGTLTGSGDISLAGGGTPLSSAVFNWTGGSVDGDGTLLITEPSPASSSTFDSSEPLTFARRRLSLGGLRWTGTADIYSAGGGSIDALGTGLSIDSDRTFGLVAPGGTSPPAPIHLTASALAKHSPGVTRLANVDLHINALSVNAGTLIIDRPVTFGGVATTLGMASGVWIYGTLQLPGSLDLHNSGTLIGNGNVIGNISAPWSVCPTDGNDVGTLTILGDATAIRNLQINVTGPADSQHGALVVSGLTDFTTGPFRTGYVLFNFLDYAPKMGDSFEFLTTGELIGWPEFSYMGLADGFTFDVARTPTGLLFIATSNATLLPEPAAAVGLLSAVPLLRRRRRPEIAFHRA